MGIQVYVENDELVLSDTTDERNVRRLAMGDLDQYTKEEPFELVYHPHGQAQINATPQDQRPLGARSQVEQDRAFREANEARDAELAATQAGEDGADAVAEEGLDNPTRSQTDGVTEQRTRPMREAVQQRREELEEEDLEEEGSGSQRGPGGRGGLPPGGGVKSDSFVEQEGLGSTQGEADPKGSTATGSRFGQKRGQKK